MEVMYRDIRNLLDVHTALEVIAEGKKVKCTLTGHEMPCKEDIIRQHVTGKKYQRKLNLHKFDYDKYKPHIVPSEKKWFKKRNQLFCKLTLRHLNCDPSHVLRHVSGKRYKSALARWEECQRTGEVFRPRAGSRPAKKQSESEETDNDDDQVKPKKNKEAKNVGEDTAWRDLEDRMEDNDSEDDNDSLADLYPAEDFEVDEASDVKQANFGNDGTSGSEFEDDSEIPEPPKKKQKQHKQKTMATIVNNSSKQTGKVAQLKAEEGKKQKRKGQKNKSKNKRT